jgi:hypothetical protein
MLLASESVIDVSCVSVDSYIQGSVDSVVSILVPRTPKPKVYGKMLVLFFYLLSVVID